MAIDRELIQDILHHADIVQVISSYINVIKKGKNYVAICPFHNDTNPSLHISPEKQIFTCFVCNQSGNAITFVMKYEKISFLEAVRKVAEIIGYHDERLQNLSTYKKPIEASKLPLINAINDLCSYYHYALKTEEGQTAYQYFINRGLDDNLQNEYLLGYAYQDGDLVIKYLNSKGHSLKTIESIGIASLINGKMFDHNQGRIIFPICDVNGQVVGFSARRLSNDKSIAKYMNTPETELFHKAEILFNYHIAKKVSRHVGYVYLLEGFMDVFALRKIGIESCVALMGTALTKEHLSILRALGAELRICLDGDNAGQSATMRLIPLLDNANIKYRIVSINDDERDPDEILNQSGAESLKQYLNRLVNRTEFALHYYQKNNPLKTLDDRKKLIFDFLPILALSHDNLEIEDCLLSLKIATNFPIEEIRKLFEKAKIGQYRQENKEQIFTSFRPERKSLRRFQLAEKEILYQMLNNDSAIAFYQKEIEYFYDEVYRKVANFIVDYYSQHQNIDVAALLAELDMGEIPDHEEIAQEITTISMEKTHPSYSETLMKECLATIVDERQKLFKKQQLEEAIRGKSPQEQAEIIVKYKK